MLPASRVSGGGIAARYFLASWEVFQRLFLSHRGAATLPSCNIERPTLFRGPKSGNVTSLPQLQIATEVAQCCSADVKQYLGSKIKHFTTHALPMRVCAIHFANLVVLLNANVLARIKLIDAASVTKNG